MVPLREENHLSVHVITCTESVDPADDIAGRLTIDSEIIVAPKTRYVAANAHTEEKHNIGSSSTSSFKQLGKSPEVEQARRQLLRILPALVRIPSLQEECCCESDELIAWVNPRPFSLLSQAFPSTRVPLRLKPCPAVSSNKKSPPQINEDTQGTGVVSPGIKGKGRVASREPSSESENLFVYVHLRRASVIPEGCIYLSKAAALALDEPDSYALVRLGPPESKSAPNGDKGSPSLSSPEAAQKSALMEISPSKPPIAGVKEHLSRCLAYIRHTIISSRGLTPYDIGHPTSGILLCGASGSGKTSVSAAIAEQALTDPDILAHVQHIQCSSLTNLRIPQLLSKLNDLFTLSAWHAPSLVVLDDLDRLIPAEVEHIDSFRSQHIANLLSSIASKAMKERPIIVLATAKGPDSLHASIMQSHFFRERVLLSAPNKNARRDVSQCSTRYRSDLTHIRRSWTLWCKRRLLKALIFRFPLISAS